jgi:hypothetical protein
MWKSAILTLMLLTGCVLGDGNRESIIDWTNFIQFNGIMYLGQNTVSESQKNPPDIGPAFDQVRFTVSQHAKSEHYKTKDGDAAFLDEGTPVYSLKGYRSDFRLAAQLEDRWVIYEADRNPRAAKGADLLDIGGKVEYIGINSEQDGLTELAAIRDSQAVTMLVQTVLEAPVHRNGQGEQAAKAAGDTGKGQRFFITFHMKDGTTVTRAYRMKTGELQRGIMLPVSFTNAVREALSAARGGTGSNGAGVAGTVPGPESGSAAGTPAVNPGSSSGTGQKSEAVPPDAAEKTAKQIVQAMKKSGLKALADYADPGAGIRFSPYGHIDTEKDLIFHVNQLASSEKDSAEYTWGVYDGSGEPIRLTMSGYFQRFVYDRDFQAAKDIAVNKVIGKGNLVNNQFDVYPRDQFTSVEFHFSGFDPKLEGHDWSSLRLVLTEKNEKIYLVGVVHDQRTV